MSKTWTKALPFFTADELACQGSGIVKLDMRFAAQLPALRMAWGSPMILNSCCRTPEHNARVKGHPRSLHLTINPKWPTWGCMAADVGWLSWSTEEQFQFALLAWNQGWSIGLHEGFCHIDRRGDMKRSELPQTVFTYDHWDGAFFKSDIVN